MAQCTTISFVQGTISANNHSSHGFSRKSGLIQYKKSCSYHEISAKFQRYGVLPSSWLGSLEGISSVANSLCKAKVLDREEGFPPIQTLRRFPIVELSSKIVMVRFDSSILLQQNMDQRISSVTSSAFLTIKHIYKAGAKVILTSSWNVNCNGKILSEEAVAELFSSVLQLKVVPCKPISAYQQAKMEQFEQADIILLENLSKYKQELANNSDFARRLSSRVDIFVNDSFSSAHKILASTVGVTQFCCTCLAGFYFEECLQKLIKITECNQSPYVAVVGGGNLKEKAAALHFLVSECDGLVFVGMMALQIMLALGMPVPLNLVEREGAEEALQIVKYAKQRSIPILLPKDFWCKHNHLQMQMEIFPAQNILDGWEPVDLGPNSLIDMATLLSSCKKIVWIGPLKFRQAHQNTAGASKLALILDELSQSDCHVTTVGQVPCEAVLQTSSSASAYDMIEHASVVWEFLKRRHLPGLLALDRAYPFEIDWNTIYPDPSRPLAVDIGSGNGLFLMGMAVMWKDLNFLGLEINEKLVTRCLEYTHQSGPKNLHFIATNATTSFRTIISSYPGQLVLVSIQCPNPDFNQPEHRWRMLQRSLVEAIADELALKGRVFLQSDVEEVAVRMRKQFLNEGRKKLAIACDDNDTTVGPGGWLKENPFGVRSDWEQHVLARGAPMYRLMLYKR